MGPLKSAPPKLHFDVFCSLVFFMSAVVTLICHNVLLMHVDIYCCNEVMCFLLRITVNKEKMWFKWSTLGSIPGSSNYGLITSFWIHVSHVKCLLEHCACMYTQSQGIMLRGVCLSLTRELHLKNHFLLTHFHSLPAKTLRRWNIIILCFDLVSMPSVH